MRNENLNSNMKWRASLWLVAVLSAVPLGQTKVLDVNKDLSTITENENKMISNIPILEDFILQPVADLDDGTDPGLEGDSNPESNGELNLEVEEGSGSPDDQANDLVIETTGGPVQGIHWQERDDIIAYLDIPYGKFGAYFEEPTEADHWTDPLVVIEHNKRCPQLDSDDSCVGDIDCLTLSIFKPVGAESTPVLFFIHESEFTYGSGDPAIYGPDYLVPQNVTLVLPNYRLGPLGFICLRNETAPGNAGLKDLTLALNWTVNNIGAFGGDPSNIAVSGDGTSSALATYLALSPVSQPFVSKVITDSGSVLSYWAIDRHPISTAEKVFNSYNNNANIGNTEGPVVFYSDLEILLRSSKNIILRPCIENEGFLADTPWNILNKTNFRNITFILGSANHAGLIKALRYNETSLTELSRNFSTILPNDLSFENANARTNVSDFVRREYFGTDNITVDDYEKLSLYFTDAAYLGPSMRTARALMTAKATVFFYEFSFEGALNKEFMTMEDAPRFGAVRGDIAGYLFTQDGRMLNESAVEEIMVQQVVELWVSFLKHSVPSFKNIVWRPLEELKEHWLEIGCALTAHTGLHEQRLRLWSDIYANHFIDRISNLAPNLAPGIAMAAFIIVYTMLFKI